MLQFQNSKLLMGIEQGRSFENSFLHIKYPTGIYINRT